MSASYAQKGKNKGIFPVLIMEIIKQWAVASKWDTSQVEGFSESK